MRFGQASRRLGRRGHGKDLISAPRLEQSHNPWNANYLLLPPGQDCAALVRQAANHTADKGPGNGEGPERGAALVRLHRSFFPTPIPLSSPLYFDFQKRLFSKIFSAPIRGKSRRPGLPLITRKCFAQDHPASTQALSAPRATSEVHLQQRKQHSGAGETRQVERGASCVASQRGGPGMRGFF